MAYVDGERARTLPASPLVGGRDDRIMDSSASSSSRRCWRASTRGAGVGRLRAKDGSQLTMRVRGGSVAECAVWMFVGKCAGGSSGEAVAVWGSRFSM
jgi:hypothetical protein